MTLSFELPKWPDQLLSRPPRISPHDPALARPERYRPEEQYVYRIDLLYSYSSWLRDRILSCGHWYGIDLGNIEQYRKTKLPYVGTIFANLDRIASTTCTRKAIYFWDNLNLAREFQLTHLRDSFDIEMNVDRVTSDQLTEWDLRRLPVISRVPRSKLPNGIFISDLNPQLIPFGLAHVIPLAPGEFACIPAIQVEFWYRGRWTHIANFDRDRLVADAANRSLSSIVPQIPGYISGI